MRVMMMVRLALLCATGFWACAPPVVAAGNRAVLREDVADLRPRAVDVELAVSGKLYPEPDPEKAIKLAVEARFDYTERRLAGEGPEAAALRSIRYYGQARASIQAGEQISNAEVRKPLRLVVARGQADGIELFSPSGPLTYAELELLHVPGDSLAILGLLPESSVEPEESWKARSWLLPL